MRRTRSPRPRNPSIAASRSPTPTVDLSKLRIWKEGIFTKLSGGITQLAKMRNVTVIQVAPTLKARNPARRKRARPAVHQLRNGHLRRRPAMRDAQGVRPRQSARDDFEREALRSRTSPENLLIIGGGYIGMEMGTVYSALGSQVTVIEAMDNILAGADPDLARPVVNGQEGLQRKSAQRRRFEDVHRGAKQIKVESEFDGKKVEELYDRVLVSVGRSQQRRSRPENTKVTLDEKVSSRSTRSCRRAIRTSTPLATSPVASCWRTRRTRKAALPSRPSRATSARRRTS